jgi:ABC-type multidrug transport system fused ATPase/permease subunit
MNVAIVLPAVFLGRAINTVLAYQRGETDASSVAWAAVAFVLANAATQLPRIGKRWWLGVARTRFQANVRADAFRGVLAWPMDRPSAMPVGEVMARIVGDVAVLGTGVGEVIVETWDTLLFAVSLVVTMFLYAPGLAAVALAPVPFALLLAKVAGRLVAERTTQARQSDADLTDLLHEQLSAFRLLRLSGRADAATRRVSVVADRQAQSELRAIRLDEALGALYTTLLALGVVFIIWLGGRQVVAGALTIGGLVAFLQLFVRFIGRAPRIPQMVNRVQAAGAAYTRLHPLLATPPPISSEPEWSSFRAAHVEGLGAIAVAPRLRQGPAVSLSFQHMTFSYPGSAHEIITDLDLDVGAGSFVAVTGPVGAGKSALARLAAGIYHPDSGRVLLDGSPVAELAPEERAAGVGYLSQEPHLFSGSIAENIALEPGVLTPEQEDTFLWWAIRLAALERDVETMPEGVSTEIGELGVRVSGGQRQRIALARALGASRSVPRLLVLDDPFSAVDVQTEASITAGLHSALGADAPPEQRATVLLFSHRLAAFPDADEVVVLDRGRIEERGPHDELLSAGGLYARIFRAQARLEAVPPISMARAGDA